MNKNADRRPGVPFPDKNENRPEEEATFRIHVGKIASSGVAHTLVILARCPDFESEELSFFSRKVRRLSRPPSRFDAALLCFQPRTMTCSRLAPRPPCRMLAWESELLVIAFWIASRVRGRPPPAAPERPVSVRAFLPRFRADPASIERSPSRSTLVAAPRLRIPPRSEPPARPREPFPFFILIAELCNSSQYRGDS